MRLVECVPKSHYCVAISLRRVGKHARDLSQRECRKGVTATLQRRAYRWRMDDLAQSQDYGGIRKEILARQIVRQL
jgi:hypothetical protein